jgi:superoxide dismutase
MESFAGAMAGLSEESSSSDSASVESPSTTPEVTSEASASPEQSPASVETAAAPVTSDTRPGPVPYERFSEVIQERNTLKEAAQRYQWAQQIQAEHGPQMAEFYQSLQRDPVGTLIREADFMAQSQPEAAAALRSAAARWLRSGSSPQAEAMPEPDYQAPDGAPIYSAQAMQKVLEWHAKQVTGQLQQQLQPLQQAHQRQQQEAAVAQLRSQATEWAGNTLRQWRAKPHFTEHEAEIKTLMSQQKDLGLADAYVEILTTKVLPKLSAQERSQVVSDMHAKAQAGTVSPSRTPVAAKARPTKFGEAYAQLVAESQP